MASQPAGSLWLKNHFDLGYYRLSHRSYIGQREKMELSVDGGVEQTYGPRYAPDRGTVLGHLEFSIKYDDISLDFLKAIFERLNEKELMTYIAANESGRYTRKIGFLYEWLTKKILPIEIRVSGNYIDLLDEDDYITGKIRKNSRWRINDNLLGTIDFCPIVRKTPALEELLVTDIKAQIGKLKEAYSAEIFNRVTQYLYRKETKSSYEIEREKPSPDRMNRFITILNQAGSVPAAEVLAEKSLTRLKNAIVDSRYAVSGYRDFQNFIGQISMRFEEIYHYICPPPQFVRSMMEGLTATENKSAGAAVLIRAAIIAFGFVFIHPFEDGNGRIHRFLIHDMLTRDGLTEKGLIIHVSAHMLNNLKDYDQTLEDYSKPLLQRIRFTSSAKGQLTVTNPLEVEAYFRYPDLTVQGTYLAHTIQATIQQDLSDELFFLERYDELKKDIQNLIDMPDRELDQVIVLLHQNKGIFPNRRKKHFPKVTEDEFEQMSKIYQEIFA